MGTDDKKTGNSLAASILLSEEATGIEEKREAIRKDCKELLNTGNPIHRLTLIQWFVSQDRTDDPLGEAIAEMLRPILGIDFDDSKGTDNKKGAIARAMGLTKGWATDKYLAKEHRKLHVDLLQKHEGLSRPDAIERAQEILGEFDTSNFYRDTKKMEN